MSDIIEENEEQSQDRSSRFSDFPPRLVDHAVDFDQDEDEDDED